MIKIALMSYAMDNRRAKGIALYTRQLISGLLRDSGSTAPDSSLDYYLVHFDQVSDPLYTTENEILMPRVRLPYGSHFISLMLFFWKYRREPFDVIHWFHPRVYPFFWLAPAKKIFVTVHGAGDISAPTNFIFSRMVFNFILKHFHTHVDTIIVVSENAKEEVMHYYGFPEHKVKVIYNGGGENFTQLDRRTSQKVISEKYAVSGNYILDVSRLIPHKNVGTLIRAYEILRRDHAECTQKLVIVGSTMDGRRDEYDLAEKSEYVTDIMFIDFAEAGDLNYIYSGADVFAFPSLSEGFGLPVLEAMASGVPVVTSNTTSMPEIAGGAAVLVDPRDVHALAQAIYTVLSDKNMRENMIQKGLARAREFTWDTMVKKTEKLYTL